jgi:hypothetical protein
MICHMPRRRPCCAPPTAKHHRCACRPRRGRRRRARVVSDPDCHVESRSDFCSTQCVTEWRDKTLPDITLRHTAKPDEGEGWTVPANQRQEAYYQVSQAIYSKYTASPEVPPNLFDVRAANPDNPAETTQMPFAPGIMYSKERKAAPKACFFSPATGTFNKQDNTSRKKPSGPGPKDLLWNPEQRCWFPAIEMLVEERGVVKLYSATETADYSAPMDVSLTLTVNGTHLSAFLYAKACDHIMANTNKSVTSYEQGKRKRYAPSGLLHLYLCGVSAAVNTQSFSTCLKRIIN